MADQVVLSAEPRPGAGKGEARTLRAQGRIPANAYGSGLEATSIHVDAKELRHALATDAGENAVIRLEFAGDTHLAMAREIHRHPVRRDILHLDFVTINRNQAVHVEVPLVVHGEVDGAVVSQVLTFLAIEVLPLEVPDTIELSVEGREVGDVIRVADLDVPAGVTVLADPDEVVVSITTPSEQPADDAELAEAAAADAEAASSTSSAEVAEVGDGQ